MAGRAIWALLPDFEGPTEPRHVKTVPAFATVIYHAGITMTTMILTLGTRRITPLQIGVGILLLGGAAAGGRCLLLLLGRKTTGCTRPNTLPRGSEVKSITFQVGVGIRLLGGAASRISGSKSATALPS